MSRHYPGSIHDFNIFKKQVKTYKQLLFKQYRDQDIEDNSPLHEEHSRHWSLIADSALMLRSLVFVL